MATNTTTEPAIGFVGLGTWAGTWPPASSPPATPSTARSEAASTLTTSSTQGLQWRDTPREVAEAAEIVFTSVPDDDVLETVASGPDGVLAGLAADKIWVDMSTVSPRASRELAERVRAQGAAMLDAPVSGSVPQVQSGTLTIMVGGDEHAYARVEPVLRELGTPTHVGENGQGLALKLAINISLAVQMLAFAEGLLLAERSGIDRELAIDVMTAEPDRLADAEGTRPAHPRPARGGVVRHRADAEGHRARARRRPAAATSRCRPPRRPTRCSPSPERWATSIATWRRSSRCWPTCRPTVKNHELHDHCGLPW